MAEFSPRNRAQNLAQGNPQNEPQTELRAQGNPKKQPHTELQPPTRRNQSPGRRAFKKIVLPLVSLLIVTIVSAAAVFAWFSPADNANNFTFQLAKINSLVYFYSGIDSSRNGVPDPMPEKGTAAYTSGDFANEEKYPKRSYTETRHFVYEAKAEAKATDFTTVTFTNGWQNYVPTQIYTAKLTLVNKSDSSNKISFRFDTSALTAEEKTVLSAIAVRVAKVGEDGTPDVASADWYYFADVLQENAASAVLAPLGNYLLKGADAVTGETEAEMEASRIKNCTCDFWLQFTMPTYETLSGNAAFQSLGMTEEAYQALQGNAYLKLAFSIYFEVDTDMFG